MPVTSMLKPDRIISGPRHDMRCSGGHDVITSRTAIVLVGRGSRDLPDIPVTIGMTLPPLTTKWIQRAIVIAAIVDAAILASHF